MSKSTLTSVNELDASRNTAQFLGGTDQTLPQATIAPLLDYDNPEQLGPSIQKIIVSGKEDVCLNQLEGIIQRKRADIEKICHGHYQEFVRTIGQLVTVRADATALKKQINELLQAYEASALSVLQRKEEIINQRSTLQNLDEGAETIKGCLAVLELATKLNQHMDRRKYFVALKAMKELRTNYMQTITDFDFSQPLSEFLPTVEDKIKEAIHKEMTDWYLKVRESQKKIGAKVLNHVIDQTKDAPGRGVTLDEDDSDQIMEILEDQTLLDCSAIYEGSHIFDVLGQLSEFSADYSENRRLQSNLLLQTPVTLSNAAKEGVEPGSPGAEQFRVFQGFLEEVIGFFTVESAVVNRTENFRSMTAVDALWDNTAQKIAGVVEQAMANCWKPPVILRLKEAMVGFMLSMEALDYSSSRLRGFMTVMFEKYCDVAKTVCGRRLGTLEFKNGDPVECKSKEELEQLAQQMAWPQSRVEGITVFPHTVQFSSMIPTVSQHIRDYVQGYCQFVRGMNRQSGEVHEVLKQSVDSILTHRISSALMSSIEGAVSFNQIVLLFYNIQALEETTRGLETYLTQKRHEMYPDAKGLVKLQSSDSFSEAQRLTQRRLFELFNTRLDGFMDLANYDYTTSSVNRSPSGYIRDLLQYLTNTVETTFSKLPENIFSNLLFEALGHLAGKFMALLTNPRVRKVNLNFIANLDMDVAFLENFVNRQESPNLRDPLLEVRQAIALMQSEDPSDFLRHGVRMKKYHRLNEANVVAMAEKLHAQMPSLITSTRDRPRKRGLEALISELKVKGRSN